MQSEDFGGQRNTNIDPSASDPLLDSEISTRVRLIVTPTLPTVTPTLEHNFDRSGHGEVLRSSVRVRLIFS